MKKSLLALSIVLLSNTAFADEALVKKQFEAKFGVAPTSVIKTNILGGLYEIYADGKIAYADEQMTTLLVGDVIDTKTMENLTQKRQQKLQAINIKDLPFSQAIKQVRGDGSRILVTFEDPNCGYCKRLAKDLQSLNNATIYTFLYPVLGPDSITKSRQIWCSKDRPKAWANAMVAGAAIDTKTDCDTSAIDKNVDLGKKLGISGTPTIFFANGERVPGAVPLAKIEERMAAPR